MNQSLNLYPEAAGFVLFQTDHDASSLIVFRDGRARLQLPSESSPGIHILQIAPAILSLLMVLPLHDAASLSIRAPRRPEAPETPSPSLPVIVITSADEQKRPHLLGWRPGLTQADEAWNILQTHQDVHGVIIGSESIMMRNGDSRLVLDHITTLLKCVNSTARN